MAFRQEGKGQAAIVPAEKVRESRTLTLSCGRSVRGSWPTGCDLSRLRGLDRDVPRIAHPGSIPRPRCPQVNQDGRASRGVDGRRRDTSPIRWSRPLCRVYLDRKGRVVCREHSPGSSFCRATDLEREKVKKKRYWRPVAREGHTATLVGDTIYIWGGDSVYNRAY
jgi:hypothetical protein